MANAGFLLGAAVLLAAAWLAASLLGFREERGARGEDGLFRLRPWGGLFYWAASTAIMAIVLGSVVLHRTACPTQCIVLKTIGISILAVVSMVCLAIAATTLLFGFGWSIRFDESRLVIRNPLGQRRTFPVPAYRRRIAGEWGSQLEFAEGGTAFIPLYYEDFQKLASMVSISARENWQDERDIGLDLSPIAGLVGKRLLVIVISVDREHVVQETRYVQGEVISADGHTVVLVDAEKGRNGFWLFAEEVGPFACLDEDADDGVAYPGFDADAPPDFVVACFEWHTPKPEPPDRRPREPVERGEYASADPKAPLEAV